MYITKGIEDNQRPYPVKALMNKFLQTLAKIPIFNKTELTISLKNP